MHDCTTPLQDAMAGRMLCEVLAATKAIQPTFGHSIGNTWLTAPADGQGTFAGCSFTTAAGWRQCVGDNIRKQIAAYTTLAPHVLFCAGLMEFLAQPNLDNGTDFATRCCQPGTVGQWGDNTTCVPDVTTPCIQEYYTEWGKVSGCIVCVCVCVCVCACVRAYLHTCGCTCVTLMSS